MRIGRLLRVTGSVQGVFFRAWTQEQARELGVSGWVRNCADGSVEAYAEGDEEPVEALIRRIHDGPPSARVEDVQVEDAGCEDLDRFEVRH